MNRIDVKGRNGKIFTAWAVFVAVLVVGLIVLIWMHNMPFTLCSVIFISYFVACHVFIIVFLHRIFKKKCYTVKPVKTME